MFQITSCNVNKHKTTLNADNIIKICIAVCICSSLSMISKSSCNNVILNNSTKKNAVATKYFITCIQEVLGIKSDVQKVFLKFDTIS